MAKEFNEATDAPAAIGPYSQATSAGGFLFISGQIPLDPKSGQLVAGIEAQTERVLMNLGAILKANGLDFSHVTKAEIFLTDLKRDFQTVNEIYARHLGSARPARATIQVSALPKGAEVEIAMVAYKG